MLGSIDMSLQFKCCRDCQIKYFVFKSEKSISILSFTTLTATSVFKNRHFMALTAGYSSAELRCLMAATDAWDF